MIGAEKRRQLAPVRRPIDLDLRPVGFVLGLLLLIVAGFMLVCLVVDLIAQDGNARGFAAALLVTVFVAVNLILMTRFGSVQADIDRRQAFLLTASVWVTLCLFAALPFWLSSVDVSFTDSVFESMSGLTTTGATIMVGLDTAPSGLLLWRAMLNWLGGIGIVVLGIAILPMLSVGGMQIFRTESSDQSEKVLPRVAQIASATGVVYVSFTAVCAMLYIAGGMSTFDAICHAMTTLSAGGFANYDASFALFQNPTIEWTGTVFMIAAAMPFVLYIRFLRGDRQSVLRDSQVRWFFGILLTLWTIGATWLILHDGIPASVALRQTAFNMTSVLTGTGFATYDYTLWGPFLTTVIFFAMFCGGCSGSATGGIKMFRFAVLAAVVRSQAQRLIHPHGVFVPLINRRPVPDNVALSVMGFFFLFLLTFAIATVALSFMGLGFVTAASAAAAALANVGPGLGEMIGPAGNFKPLPDPAKWILTFVMLLGRLEIFTIVVLFTPRFWRN
ncbi:TrkH family potassium uptake protein [Marinivivus vitaminiproducens]|uniref:TrkH family potassium uptake protein n=1 Tax=Marinivivus vitaminiproducens TaxID=3035935 RepID=UPI0027A6D978|nr:TrkH family potassium uptake protein [Geminicoccaceae bacterium SCSIO 64248]